MGKQIKLHNKIFRESIPYAVIERSIKEMASRINEDYRDRPVPVFLSVLNGAFMFTAELMKYIDFQCELSFVKLASYEGGGSAGNVTELIGLSSGIEGRDVIVLEDIVETGTTIEAMDKLLSLSSPNSVRYAALFFKPEAYTKEITIDYYAMKLDCGFIVGFGLDYDRLGRNFKDVYTLADE